MTKKKIAWIDDEINKFLLRPYIDELEENNYEVDKINSTENLIQHLKEESLFIHNLDNRNRSTFFRII